MCKLRLHPFFLIGCKVIQVRKRKRKSSIYTYMLPLLTRACVKRTTTWVLLSTQRSYGFTNWFSYAIGSLFLFAIRMVWSWSNVGGETQDKGRRCCNRWSNNVVENEALHHWNGTSGTSLPSTLRAARSDQSSLKFGRPTPRVSSFYRWKPPGAKTNENKNTKTTKKKKKNLVFM